MTSSGNHTFRITNHDNDNDLDILDPPPAYTPFPDDQINKFKIDNSNLNSPSNNVNTQSTNSATSNTISSTTTSNSISTSISTNVTSSSTTVPSTSNLSVITSQDQMTHSSDPIIHSSDPESVSNITFSSITAPHEPINSPGNLSINTFSPNPNSFDYSSPSSPSLSQHPHIYPSYQNPYPPQSMYLPPNHSFQPFNSSTFTPIQPIQSPSSSSPMSPPILNYPPGFYCPKCQNSGYKSHDKPCRSCWNTFSPIGNNSNSLGGFPIPPGILSPPISMMTMPAPLPQSQHLPFASSAPLIVQPGDPRLGGLLCPKCHGRGFLDTWYMGTEACKHCHGMGRL